MQLDMQLNRIHFPEVCKSLLKVLFQFKMSSKIIRKLKNSPFINLKVTQRKSKIILRKEWLVFENWQILHSSQKILNCSYFTKWLQRTKLPILESIDKKEKIQNFKSVYYHTV